MANTILTDTVVAKEGMRIFYNSLGFCKTTNRDYESEFSGPVKTGTSIRVRKPAQWTPRTASNTFSSQNMLEEYNTLTINAPDGIDSTLTQAEMDMSIDSFSDRILKTQMPRLASKVDETQLNLAAKYAGTHVNAASTSLAFADVVNLRARMVENCLPSGEQIDLFANPTDQVQLLTDTKGLFQNSNELGGQYVNGMMGKFGGFNWRETNLLGTITPPADVAGAVNDASFSNGTSALAVDTFTASQVIPAGAVITIAGVYDVNPETKATSATLKTFRVLTALTLSTGAGTLALTEKLFDSTDSRQNVSALPADDAVVTIVGTASTAYRQNLGIHKDAWTTAFVDMELPKGVDMGSKETYEGITMRFVRDWDFDSNTWKSRWDVQYGGCPLRSEWSGILSNF